MKQKVLETLDRLHIPYEYEDHPAAYTMEEIEALHLTRPNESIAKNLFLRDENTPADHRFIQIKFRIGGTSHEASEGNERLCLSHGNLKR